MNTSKLVKISKVLDKVFKIVQTVLVSATIVSVIVLAVLTIVNAVDPDAVIGEDLHIVDAGAISIELAPDHAPDNDTILLYAWITALLAAIGVAIVFYMLRFIRNILKPMTEGNPFSPTIGNDIRKIAYLSLAMGIINNVLSLVETVSVVQILNLHPMPESSRIQSVSANFQVDLTFLAVFGILLLVSHIFRYGAELQRLSDETL